MPNRIFKLKKLKVVRILHYIKNIDFWVRLQLQSNYIIDFS